MKKILFFLLLLWSNYALAQMQSKKVDRTNVFTIEGNTSLLVDYPTYPRDASQSLDSVETKVDITTYLQQAVDQAAVVGGIVKLKPGWYKLTGTINVPEGVTIEGSPGKFGVYAVPYEDWRNSGTLVYFEPSVDNIAAFRFYGTLTGGRESKIGGLRDLTIMGANVQSGVTAILVDGDGHMLSSGVFKNVLVHGFRNGHGLHLRANNDGAVTYFSFDDMRFRDCDTSIHLQALSGGSGAFVNSNIFRNTVISGGDLDYAILAETELSGDPTLDCNHNQFYGGSIEPQYCSKGHVVVLRDAWVVMKDVRVEATQQFAFYPDVRPIYLDSTSQDNYLDIFATVEVDNRSPYSYVKTKSPKNAYPTLPSSNVMINTNFTNLYVQGDTIYQLPGYNLGIADFSSSTYSTTLSDTVYMATKKDPTLNERGNVLVVGVPKDKKIRIWQQPFTDWQNRLGQYFTVGAWVKADYANSAQWIYTYNRSGTVSTIGSEFHYVLGEWTFIGATFQNYPDNESFVVYLTAFNDPANGVDTNFVEFYQPAMVWGQELSLEQGGWLPKAGGKMDGTLSLNSYTSWNIDDPDWIDTSGNTSRLYLPTNANVFKLRSNSVRQITSINVAVGTNANNDNVKYFQGGTEITLIIDSFQYIRFNESAYLHLTNGEDFVPKMAGNWIKLVNDPVAVNVWYEVGRGHVETNYGSVSIDYSDPTYHDSGNSNRLALPYKSNYVTITNSGSGTIQYISQVTGYRQPGEVICIYNNSGNSITLDYPFIETANSQDFILEDGEKIFLMATAVTGVWTEIARSQDQGANYGNYDIDMTVDNEGTTNYMLIPYGHDYVTVTVASGPIQRINQSFSNRRPAGNIIVVKNGTGSDISLQEPYIDFVHNNSSQTLKDGESIVLVTDGAGIWYELYRINNSRTVVKEIEQHLLDDLETTNANTYHFVIKDTQIDGFTRMKEGLIWSSTTTATTAHDVPLYTATTNLHKGMFVQMTIEDADGTNKIYDGLVVWDYNGNSINTNWTATHLTGVGTWNGTEPTFSKVGSDIVVTINTPTENNQIKIYYKLL